MSESSSFCSVYGCKGWSLRLPRYSRPLQSLIVLYLFEDGPLNRRGSVCLAAISLHASQMSQILWHAG